MEIFGPIDLKKLSEAALLEKTGALAKEERRISMQVIYHLREIDRRRAFAKLNYLSLFDYAVKELLYSESAAMRRINAARALASHPELAEKMESGKISVTQVSRIQSFIHKDEKQTGQKWETTEKEALFAQAEVSSSQELEKILVTISPVSAVKESVKAVSASLMEVKVYLSDEELKDLNEVRGLLAHQLKDPGSNSELIKKMIQISKGVVIRQKFGGKKSDGQTGTTHSKTAKQNRKSNHESKIKTQTDATSQRSSEKISQTDLENASQIKQDLEKENMTEEEKRVGVPSKSRSIRVAVKRFVFRRSDIQCEHVDPKTKIRCGSKFKLELDHRVPYSLGGKNEADNLRVLCRGHNANRARML